MERKSNSDEENCEHCEAHELDRLAAEGIDGGHRNPVTRDGTGAYEDDVSNGGSVEDIVHVVTTCVSDSTKDDRVIEAKAIVSNVYKEISM